MRYVIISGANGGMGHATAKMLANAGYFVFALDLKPCPSEERIFPISVDITNEDSVSSAISVIREHTSEIYAVLHFAGVYMLGSLVEMGEDELLRAFEINVLGAARLNRLALPLLSSGSRVIITSSELAPLDPLPFTGLYAITKSTLEKYAYSLRMELQLLGISVSIIRPGAVKTAMLGVSCDALERFCNSTELYSCNAKRFKQIVDGVEARNVAPEKVARKAMTALRAKHPRYVYRINRNPLLLLLNVLPNRLQTFIIRMILAK